MTKIKNGMAGSRCGKGRRETTSWLKNVSKKPRRTQGRQAIAEQQNEGREPAFTPNAIGITFRLVIVTQVYENYGAHDWDGEGPCPQYWKAKGGSEYQRNLGDANAIIALGQKGLQTLAEDIAATVTKNDEAWMEYMIDWHVVPSNEETWEERFLREMHEDGSLDDAGYAKYRARLLI